MLIIVIALVIVMLLQVRDQDVETHGNNLVLLLQAKDLSARLDRDMMQAVSFRMTEHDQLVSVISKMQDLIMTLQSQEQGLYKNIHTQVDQAVDAHIERIEEKLLLLEQIKHTSAVVRNGLNYLPKLVAELHSIGGDKQNHIAELMNKLYLFNLFPSEDEASRIRSYLDGIAIPYNLNKTQESLLLDIIINIRSNLTDLARLAELQSRYDLVSSAQTYDELYSVYTKFHAKSIHSTRLFSFFMLGLTAVLLLALWLLLGRLHASSRKAEQSWLRLHDAVDSLSEAFALFDSTGKLVLHNRKWREFYPWLKGHLAVGTPLSELRCLSEGHFSAVTADGRDVSREIPPGRHTIEYTQKFANGNWYLASDNRTAEGGLACVRVDITNAKQSEVELRKLSQAVEQSPVSVVITDTKGDIEYVNPKFVQTSGYSVKDVLGKKLESGGVDEGQSREMWETLAAGLDWRGYFHNIRKDGAEYWESASISPLRGADGEVTHYISVKKDITDQRRRELELRKLTRALEQSQVSVVITNTTGCIEYVNPKFEEVSGYSAIESIGQNPRMLKSGNKSQQEYHEMWETILAGNVWRGTFYNVRKNGSGYWESASISPVRDERGETTHFIAVKEDITQRKLAEDQLRMNAAVFETTSEGIMVTDANNRIKTVNPAFSRITGYLEHDALGMNPNMLSSGRHDRSFYCQMWNEIKENGHWSGEVWNRRKDGSVFPEWLSIVVIKGESDTVKEYVSVFSDITKRKRDEEQIRRQAYYDALTGLPNRSLLVDRLAQGAIAARREDWLLALLFIDLDRFKEVNDSLGHVIGDELLQDVADRLKECVREVDTVSRFGGDEFVLLLQDLAEVNDAAVVADKVIAILSKPFFLAGREIYIGASIGITLYPTDADNTEAMLRNADMAMYRAKEAGRNRYQYFTQCMQEQVKARVDMEHDLRQALERNELELYYQPIVDAVSNSLASVEALLRWNHPALGMVPPDKFIPLAEESGLIGVIGDWVLKTACNQAKTWRNSGIDIGMSVNLSCGQRSMGLTSWSLASILKETGLPGGALNLEITEGVLMEDSAEVVEWLQGFKRLGVSLSIDDFGTGYSSLSYLKRFPVDVLKIDRAFIKDMVENQEDASLVNAILAMGKSLGLRLVAEGVETDQQRNLLQKYGCDYLQGYLFGEPMPEEIFQSWISGQDQVDA